MAFGALIPAAPGELLVAASVTAKGKLRVRRFPLIAWERRVQGVAAMTPEGVGYEINATTPTLFAANAVVRDGRAWWRGREFESVEAFVAHARAAAAAQFGFDDAPADQPDADEAADDSAD
jgi:hypothetical protein